MEVCGRMGILAGERFRDAGTDHTAVSVIGLREQQDVLRSTAACCGVTAPQICTDADLQIIHDIREASLAERSSVFFCDGYESDMSDLFGTSHGTG